jgi:hypothetical protein
MLRNVAALTLTLLTAGSFTASAADRTSDAAAGPQRLTAAAAQAAKSIKLEDVSPVFAGNSLHRPVALPVLYGTYGILQGLDFASTRKAIAAGAYEANPVMKSGSPATMLAVKAATGAATIYLAERTWKKNRIGGIVMMAVLNGATAAVVAHNMQNARR